MNNLVAGGRAMLLAINVDIFMVVKVFVYKKSIDYDDS